MERLDLDYYYGKEAEQFTFYRLPKVLITDSRFNGVSNNAKLLYGLMLDRMSLSRKRGWLDDENRVYIKYSVVNIAEDLNIVKNTGAALLKELQDVGLIDMIQQNGKANIIYVKNFVSEAKADSQADDEETGAIKKPVEKRDQLNKCTSTNNEPVEIAYQSTLCPGSPYDPVEKNDQLNSDEETSSKTEKVPSQNLVSNNNIDNNLLRDNNPIHLSVLPSREIDAMDEAEAYMDIIKENIDYDIMMSSKEWRDRDMFDELYNIICDVVCVPRKTIRIGGEDYPYQLVKSKFLKLKASHLEYVMSCMQRNTTKVNNIKAYLITALYNAPNTIDHYYTAEVNHDMYGVG